MKNEEIAKIEAITPSKDYKNNAIAELENVANQRKHDLTQDPDMTKEEYDYAIDSVDRMLDKEALTYIKLETNKVLMIIKMMVLILSIKFKPL